MKKMIDQSPMFFCSAILAYFFSIILLNASILFPIPDLNVVWRAPKYISTGLVTIGLLGLFAHARLVNRALQQYVFQREAQPREVVSGWSIRLRSLLLLGLYLSLFTSWTVMFCVERLMEYVCNNILSAIIMWNISLCLARLEEALLGFSYRPTKSRSSRFAF